MGEFAECLEGLCSGHHRDRSELRCRSEARLTDPTWPNFRRWPGGTWRHASRRRRLASRQHWDTKR